MPRNNRTETFYEQNKDECKELINDILGEHFGKSPRVITRGDARNQQRRNVNPYVQYDDKSLRKSSEKALKAVFEDPELGEKAFNYLTDLKNTEGKTEEKQQEDLNKFEQRAKDTRSLLGGNKRNLSLKDALSPRVVGQATANKNRALAAGAGVAAIGASAATGGIFTALASATFVSSQFTAGAYMLGAQGAAVAFGPAGASVNHISDGAMKSIGSKGIKEKTATKINPGKSVKTDSKGVEADGNAGLRAYGEMELDYKDLLFHEMTGMTSQNYDKSKKRLEAKVNTAVEKKILEVRDGASSDQAEKLLKQKYQSNNPKDRESSDISKRVASFLTGEDVDASQDKKTHLERLQSREGQGREL